MQVSEPTGGVAAGQENPGDRTRPARPPPPLLLNLRSAGPACNRRRVPGGMGYDGRIGMRLSPWPRALQLPRGRGARGAAPERARGLPSVKAPACIASTPGASTLFCPRRAVRCPVPRRRGRGPRPHPGHQPIPSLCWKRLRFGPVPVGEHHLAAAVSQGDQLADPFRDRSGSNGAILVVDAANGVIRNDRLTGRQTTLPSSGMFARPLAITVAR